jgi:hypothetical protein
MSATVAPRLSAASKANKLLRAARDGDLAECEQALREGADINHLYGAFNMWKTLGWIASPVGTPDISKYLWVATAKDQVEDTATLLQIAIKEKRTALIQWLMNKPEVRLDLRNTRGRTAEDCAVRAGDQAIITFFQQCKAQREGTATGATTAEKATEEASGTDAEAVTGAYVIRIPLDRISHDARLAIASESRMGEMGLGPGLSFACLPAVQDDGLPESLALLRADGWHITRARPSFG